MSLSVWFPRAGWTQLFCSCETQLFVPRGSVLLLVRFLNPNRNNVLYHNNTKDLAGKSPA